MVSNRRLYSLLLNLIYADQNRNIKDEVLVTIYDKYSILMITQNVKEYQMVRFLLIHVKGVKKVLGKDILSPTDFV